MAPKRKNNNNKKRRPKTTTTSLPTPDASPSKTITPHSPTTPPTPDDHSTSSSPIKSSHQDHSTGLELHPQPLITASIQAQNDPPHPILPNSHIDPIPLSQRSLNLPGSNHKSDHHQRSDQSSLPIKSTTNQQFAKPIPAAHLVKDSSNAESTENKTNSKTSNILKKPNSSHHSADRSPQPPADHVLQEIPNGTLEQPHSNRDQIDLTPVKSSEESTKTPSHQSNSFKKPIKHVKFTKNVKNDQSRSTQNQENQKIEQNHPIQSNREADQKSGSKNKQNSIRRELSGAADQFDFDAQQRQHAGPGGGMVKKPRHDQINSNQSPGSNSTGGEAEQVSSDASPGVSRDKTNHPSNYNKGFQHAQRCQKAWAQAQHVNQPNDANPDVFQIYLSYFDQNQDGLLGPLDTWRAFRRLRFGPIIATVATISLCVMMIPFIVLGRSKITFDHLQMHYLPIGPYLFELTSNLSNIIVTTLSSEIFKRFLNVRLDREENHYPDKISPFTLWKETRHHFGLYHMTDPIGWLRVVFGWMIVAALTRPSDLSVKHELIDGVYNGEILFLIAQDL